MEFGKLSCSVAVEHLDSSGCALRRTVFGDSALSLCRNEFHDIILTVLSAKGRQTSIMIRSITIHKSKLREGKASLIINPGREHVFLCNCPPSPLQLFLEGLSAKLRVQQTRRRPVTAREALASIKPRSLEEVSPLSPSEVSQTSVQRPTSTTPTSRVSSAMNVFDSFPRRKALVDRSNRLDSSGSGKAGLPYPPKRKLFAHEPSPFSFTKSQHVSVLSKDGREALYAVRSGVNVFITGSAGTGKSFLMRSLMEHLPPDTTHVTASTGVAASHLGGVTLHSWAGVGDGSGSVEHHTARILASRELVSRWRSCTCLIIDEISMIDGDYFDMLDRVGRSIRGSDVPFGGLQLIVCGDFLQLPPVSKTSRKNFCFQSSSWKTSIHATVELMEVRRQSEMDLVNILQALRVGKCPDEAELVLRQSETNILDQNGIQATRLCSHKEDAGFINATELAKLGVDVIRFTAVDSDSSLSTRFDDQLHVSRELELAVGAQVMLCRNLDLSKKLVNGSRGIIIRFNSGCPVVRFSDGYELTVRPETFAVKSGETIFTRKQLPLQLAWGISIHKSQGLTLDVVEVSLSKVFEYGQAYVALSRARSLKGLRVLDFARSCIKAHPDVLQYYINLRRTALTAPTHRSEGPL